MKDRTGVRYGRLIALEAHHKDKNNHWHWLCRCDCGNTHIVSGDSLSKGATRSCGCLNDEQRKTGNNRRTHGCWGTRLYRTWKQIHTRCNNQNTEDYKKWYGSKGIKVCREWDEFEPFKRWALDHGYTDELTIDRINNQKDYSPENCRWVTPKEQSRNTSQNINLMYNGETHCLAEWAEILGVNASTLRCRYRKGWSTERILTQPIRQSRKRG